MNAPRLERGRGHVGSGVGGPSVARDDVAHRAARVLGDELHQPAGHHLDFRVAPAIDRNAAPAPFRTDELVVDVESSSDLGVVVPTKRLGIPVDSLANTGLGRRWGGVIAKASPPHGARGATALPGDLMVSQPAKRRVR